MAPEENPIERVGRAWHRFTTASEPMPATDDELPLAEGYRFVGPPMTFTDPHVFVEMNRRGGFRWMTGGGPTELLAQYSDGEEWFTSVLTFHSASSDRRVTAVHTSRIVDGKVVEDLLAYDPRVAYNKESGLQARLASSLAEYAGVTFGLP